MLYYFRCMTCHRVSDLFLPEEVGTKIPECVTCEPTGGSLVERKSAFAFYFGCRECKKAWSLLTSTEYRAQKKARPICPDCHTAKHVFFVPPNVDLPSKVEKRQKPGLLNPKKYDPKQVGNVKPKLDFITGKKRKFELEQSEDDLLTTSSVDDRQTVRRVQGEGAYKKRKLARTNFINTYGQLKTERNPLKTSEHTGTLVTLDRTREIFKHTGKIDGEKYPRQSNSAPIIVNTRKVVPREKTWDYRELGPSSFLRRLSSLLYMIDFSGTVTDPVELQAMWAAGSLYISANNYTYSDKLLKALESRGTLKSLIGELDLNDGKGGTYTTTPRNFKNTHKNKMPLYKKEFVDNGKGTYPTYFTFQWSYVFNDLRGALDCTSIDSILVKRNGDDESDYTQWTFEGTPEPGKIYIVKPLSGRSSKAVKKFKKKDIHAEQMFFPILIKLNQLGKLSMFQPAFVGGVKTPCRTCAMVLKKASDRLKSKLILPTDAFGNYWEASGMHVPDKEFDETDESMVFGSVDSENIFDTELPTSPLRNNN